MGRVYASHHRWVRGYVIPVKVVQDERDTEVTGRESQQHRKTTKKVLAITPGIPGVLN